MSKQKQALLEAYARGYRCVNGVVSRRDKVVTGRIDANGYRVFTIRLSSGGLSTVPFHRLVAYGKYGERLFEKSIQVRHFDGDKSNNVESNILIGTPSQNAMDKPLSIRIRSAMVAASYVRKYDHKEVIAFHRQCGSYSKTMEKFGISSKGTLNFILKQSAAL